MCKNPMPSALSYSRGRNPLANDPLVVASPTACSKPTRNRLPVRLYIQAVSARNGMAMTIHAAKTSSPATFVSPPSTKSGRCCSANSTAVTTAASQMPRWA